MGDGGESESGRDLRSVHANMREGWHVFKRGLSWRVTNIESVRLRHRYNGCGGFARHGEAGRRKIFRFCGQFDRAGFFGALDNDLGVAIEGAALAGWCRHPDLKRAETGELRNVVSLIEHGSDNNLHAV